FETSLYFNLFLGFILLCCASSFNYIINDIADIEKDKLHPEKLKKKPLASGALSIRFAIFVLFFLIFLITISIIFLINPKNLGFMIMIILIIITGQLYNHLFKNYAFIDILILSTGYLWRALAGCMIIQEFISAWLFLAIFEVASFLSIAKRKGDLKLLSNIKKFTINILSSY
ncbi:MAG: UbiA family prenyltransferase, partial [Promethearchaeota archaeon]